MLVDVARCVPLVCKGVLGTHHELKGGILKGGEDEGMVLEETVLPCGSSIPSFARPGFVLWGKTRQGMKELIDSGSFQRKHDMSVRLGVRPCHQFLLSVKANSEEKS